MIATLLILILIISFIWKLMSPPKRNNPAERRFSIRKHRLRKRDEDDDAEE